MLLSSSFFRRLTGIGAFLIIFLDSDISDLISKSEALSGTVSLFYSFKNFFHSSVSLICLTFSFTAFIAALTSKSSIYLS